MVAIPHMTFWGRGSKKEPDPVKKSYKSIFATNENNWNLKLKIRKQWIGKNSALKLKKIMSIETTYFSVFIDKIIIKIENELISG